MNLTIKREPDTLSSAGLLFIIRTNGSSFSVRRLRPPAPASPPARTRAPAGAGQVLCRDLALDIGCFHSLTADARGRYLNGLHRLLRPGARWMLYAFGPRRRGAIDLGITTEAMKSLSQPDFRLLRVEGGSDPSGPAAAWYWLERI